MTTRKPLVQGVLGSVMVDHFQTEHMLTPVEAELLNFVEKDVINYRITFEDESVSDWKLTFDPIDRLNFHILSAEKYNEVL